MIQKIVLKNGVRVLTQKVPAAASVSVGIFVKNGAIDENSSNAGISHFIEHILFKGTKTRSAHDIAIETDRVGGNMNAYTTKEYTCYYAKVLSEDVLTPVSILADMYFNSLFAQKDIEVEQNVVLEEINMYEDSPEDMVCDILCEEVWKGSRLQNSILGTPETVKSFTSEMLFQYVNEHYTPENTVISIVGNFDEEKTLSAVDNLFSGFLRPCQKRDAQEIPYRQAFFLKEKEIEQNHLCFGFPGLRFDSPDVYTLSVLSSIFGGAMSSRLFQTLREEKGLCYGIYSFSVSHEESGLFAIHVALAKKYEKEAIDAIMGEISSAAAKGFSNEEVEMGIRQVKASFLMSNENVSSRMQSYAKREIMNGKIKTTQERLESLQAVTHEGVNELARRILSPDGISLAVVGECEDRNDYQDILNYQA